MKTTLIIAVMFFFAACGQKETKPVKPAGSGAPTPAPEKEYVQTQRKFVVKKIEKKKETYHITCREMNNDNDTVFKVKPKYPDTVYPGNIMIVGSIPERTRIAVIFTTPLSPKKEADGELWIGPVDGTYPQGNTTTVVLF